MYILVIGSGGREHAICDKLVESPLCEGLFIAPGNAGTAALGTNVDLGPLDGKAVADFVEDKGISLVVVGPEGPLAEGLADALRTRGIPTVGPGWAGAVIESSKEWSKGFMGRYGIPTAGYRSFTADRLADAIVYVQGHALPVVVKASGLAAGKGVVICESHSEAEAAVREMLGGEAFGDAGTTVVIEEFLVGREVSVFVLTDGKDYLLLPEAKDYKRIGEGDTGPNTGGMGAVSPVPFADAAFMQKVTSKIIEPTLHGLAAEAIPYRGFIFFGLIEVNGEPYVIEYNARMGDPETEVVFPRIASDIVPVLVATAEGRLGGYQLEFRNEACATVVVVSGGYPGHYRKGMPILGLDKLKDVKVFHAGTLSHEAQLRTSGGRVLALTAFGADIWAAAAKATAAAEGVAFEGKYYRRDIGEDLRQH